MSRWRQKARAAIVEALAATEGRPVEERMRAVDKAYPFGSRSNHPYKVWLDERRKMTAALRDMAVLAPAPKRAAVDPAQMDFESLLEEP